MSATIKPKFLSIQEVADHLGVHYNTVHRMAVKGEIPNVQVGDRRLIPATFLEELLEAANAVVAQADARRAAEAIDRNRAKVRAKVRQITKPS